MSCRRSSRFWGLGCPKIFHEIEDSLDTPNTARREVRKLETAAMHEQWRKEYRTLKKKQPTMSDVWCSQQIAKMECANGRRPETIRKQMKK